MGCCQRASARPDRRSQGGRGLSDSARILLVDSDGLNPYGFVIAQALTAERLDVCFARRAAGVDRPLGDAFGPVRADRFGLVRRSGRMCRLALSLARLSLRQRHADVLHLLWESPFDAVLAVVARTVWGIPVVATIHDATRSSRSSRIARAVLVQLAARTVMHSDAQRALLMSLEPRLSAQRIILLPLPNFSAIVRPLDTAEGRRLLGLGPRSEIALFFGQIRPYKGPELLIQVFQQLLAERPDLHVVLAGRSDGHWLDEDLAQLQRRDGARVHLLVGTKPVDEGLLLSLIAAADLVVLPFRRLAQSASAVLALSIGAPLVTTAIGENHALRAADAARVVPGDAQSLVSACSDLLDDPAERRALARRGRDYARTILSPDVYGRALLAAYPEILQRRTLPAARRAASEESS
jgi:glycosyltransferase involved in cell wall biosynthesis